MTEGEAAKAQRRGLRRRQVPRWCLRVSVHLQRGSSQGTFLSWLAATSFCVAGTSFHSSLKKENKQAIYSEQLLRDLLINLSLYNPFPEEALNFDHSGSHRRKLKEVQNPFRKCNMYGICTDWRNSSLLFILLKDSTESNERRRDRSTH